MDEDDAPGWIANGLSRLSVLQLALAQYLRSQLPQIDWNLRDRDNENEIGDAASDGRREPHREHEGRKGHHRIHDPHDDLIQPAAAKAGESADKGSDQERQEGRDEWDKKIDARGDDDPGELVATVIVGSQYVIPAWLLQDGVRVRLVRIQGRNPGS